MAKELVFMSAQPDDNYFVWQIEAQIENFKNLGYEYEYHVLLYKPIERKIWNFHMKELEHKYEGTNVKFFWFEGDSIVKSDTMMISYIPLLRPYCLEKHFANIPELKDKVIFYIDSDVIFNKKLDFTPYLEDEMNYLSNTSHYLNLEYLESKIEQALPHKLEQLRKAEVVENLASSVGISREIIKANDSGTGGAQYILKNIDSKFWKDVYRACIDIRSYLAMMNLMYFESENHGWQSWCADMWAVLWNLWKRGYKTETPSELDFSWASDPITKLDEVSIFHNAGANSTTIIVDGNDLVIFYKGKYSNNGISPHKDKNYLELVSDKLASRFYVNHLLSINNPIF